MRENIFEKIEVHFPTMQEADYAINYLRNKIKESDRHYASVMDLISCSGYRNVSYKFALLSDEEVGNWGWSIIDGYSIRRDLVTKSVILTMPPAKRIYYPLTPPPEPYKEMRINVPRMKIIEDICENTKLREEINSKIKKCSDMDHYGYRFVLEYQHQNRGKKYRVEYRVPFDSPCYLEFWPDEEVDKYLDEQENKARKELIDRVIKDINKGDANNMPTQFDLSGFMDLSTFTCTSGITIRSARVRLPKISNIEMYNDRVVKVTFDDGSFTKSVCQENDIFDLDVGITVCLMKKMLDDGKGNGTRIYNDIIRDAHKLINDKENEKIEKQMEKEKQKKKAHKAIMKKQAKKMKAKEEAIDIQKQAFIRAMQETGMTGNVD